MPNLSSSSDWSEDTEERRGVGVPYSFLPFTEECLGVVACLDGLCEKVPLGARFLEALGGLHADGGIGGGIMLLRPDVRAAAAMTS